MVYADLHVHTTNSDGALTLDTLPSAAKEADISVVGVTDHDRAHPGLDGPVTRKEGVIIVHGIELKVETPTQRVDLLGYGVEMTSELRAETERLGADRVRRGQQIRTGVERELGVDLPLEVDEQTGRPHIARAVVSHPETAYDDISAVFADLIGTGRPCFVAREVPSFERGLDLLREAARFVGLAHPFRYDDPEAALGRCADLDAVERYYPYARPTTGEPAVDTGAIESTIETHELLETGGSDAHDEELGVAGLDEAGYQPIADALSPEP